MSELLKKGTTVYFSTDFGSVQKGTLVYDTFDYLEGTGEIPVWVVKVDSPRGYYNIVITQDNLSLHDEEYEKQQAIETHRQSIKELEQAIRDLK